MNKIAAKHAVGIFATKDPRPNNTANNVRPWTIEARGVFPPNLIFLGRLEHEELFNLLRDSDFGLDLRESFNSYVSDFPSKIFTYLQFNLRIISTKSESISKPISDILIPVNSLSNINEIDYYKYLSNSKEVINYIENNSLDKVLSLID